MAAITEITRELAKADKLLESGDWVPGMDIIHAIADGVAPGRAFRRGFNVALLQMMKRIHTERPGGEEEWRAELIAELNAKAQTESGRAEIIARGKRARVIHAINSKLKYGTWESDPSVLQRAHWRGEAPFYLRRVHDPTYSVKEVAAMLGHGVTESVLRGWLTEELAPPAAPRDRRQRSVRLEERWLPVYRQIASVYRPHSKIWKIDPRSFWHPMYNRPCPNCGTPVQLHGPVSDDQLADDQQESERDAQE